SSTVAVIATAIVGKNVESLRAGRATVSATAINPSSLAKRRDFSCENSVVEALQTSRLWRTAAAMNDVNSGCGASGRDFNSGWNWTPMNQGCSGISMIS